MRSHLLALCLLTLSLLHPSLALPHFLLSVKREPCQTLRPGLPFKARIMLDAVFACLARPAKVIGVYVASIVLPHAEASLSLDRVEFLSRRRLLDLLRVHSRPGYSHALPLPIALPAQQERRRLEVTPSFSI
jgi:hypothetical protein